MQVLDPAELEFPFRRVTMFEGLEQLPNVLADPSALRKAYLKEFNDYIRCLKQGCRMHRIDYVQMRTDQTFDVALSTYLGGDGGDTGSGIDATCQPNVSNRIGVRQTGR